MTIPQEVPRQRRVRSDAGQIRITDRDLMIFAWLVNMKAIYEPDLRVLIGRLTGRVPGEPAVRALTRRWRAADVADARKLIVSKPRIVRLRPNGARLVGESSYRETAEFTAYHQAEVSRLRLWMEGHPHSRHGAVVAWESEREFRQSTAALLGPTGGREVHVPDGVAVFADGTRAAVEVERSVKSPDRLRTVLERVLAAYPMVIYAVASDEVASAVTAAHRAVVTRHQKRGLSGRLGELVVRPIPSDLIEEV